jgi:hypothetical protein
MEWLKTGCADNMNDTCFGGNGGILSGCVWRTEIQYSIRACEQILNIGCDGDSQRTNPSGFSDIGSQHGGTRTFRSPSNGATGRFMYCSNEVLSHAPCGAHNGKFHGDIDLKNGTKSDSGV